MQLRNNNTKVDERGEQDTNLKKRGFHFDKLNKS